VENDLLLALLIYIQLYEAFGATPFEKVFTEYRHLPDAERPKSGDEKRDEWLVRLSKTVRKNLGPFFQAWGVPTSQRARARAALPRVRRLDGRPGIRAGPGAGRLRHELAR